MSKPPVVPTLDDVAREAGVSTATVSRCLNNSEKVTAKTRERVARAIDLLGYSPNFGARAMAAKRTFTIGAIIPTMENAIFARGLQAFQEALYAQGYTLLVASSAYKPEIEAEQIRALVARGADGLLLIGYDRDPSIYDFLARRGVPTLVSWAFSKGSPQPSIGFDNRASMRALAEKVLDMGHRRIAVISATIKGNDRASERLEGIRDALRHRGIDPDTLAVTETAYGVETGAEAFDVLMRVDPRPTVVMCGNDVLAVGAMQRAHERGMDIPRDVSITGFDDIELARIVTPQLTTVHVPHREMGRRAASELIAMVDKKSAGDSLELQVSLEIRGSLRALD